METDSGEIIMCSAADYAASELPCPHLDGADPQKVGYPPFWKGCTCVVLPCRKPYISDKDDIEWGSPAWMSHIDNILNKQKERIENEDNS